MYVYIYIYIYILKNHKALFYPARFCNAIFKMPWLRKKRPHALLVDQTLKPLVSIASQFSFQRKGIAFKVVAAAT